MRSKNFIGGGKKRKGEAGTAAGWRKSEGHFPSGTCFTGKRAFLGLGTPGELVFLGSRLFLDSSFQAAQQQLLFKIPRSLRPEEKKNSKWKDGHGQGEDALGFFVSAGNVGLGSFLGVGNRETGFFLQLF